MQRMQHLARKAARGRECKINYIAPMRWECRPLLHDAARPMQQSLQRVQHLARKVCSNAGVAASITRILLWREQPAMGRRRE
jgi:hypothetical protein